MKKIRTVAGDVRPETFGQTMIHEHVILDLSHIRKDHDPVLEDTPELNLELEHLKKSGCGGIVEVTNIGMGRNVRSLRDLSIRHEMPIVASTGFYIEPYFPANVFTMPEEEMVELFVFEVTKGIGETGIQAGIISEIGSSLNNITPTEEKVFRAACQAQAKTGAPLSTHCELGTMGSAQLGIFKQYDLDLSKVSIGHQDLNGNRDEYEFLLRTGIYIQFDTIGKNAYRPADERIEDLLYLLDRGYAKQIMLSCDITKKSYLRVNGGFGYQYLFDTFLPAIRERGVAEEEIKMMLVENPRRFLCF